MNPSTTSIDLNVGLPNIAVVSYAVQGDQQARVITAHLYDGSDEWTPPAGAIGIIRFRTPLGTSGLYDTDEDGNTAVTWSGNVATLRIVQNAIAVAGCVPMQLEFYQGSQKLSAFSWMMIVEPSVLTDTEFMQTDYYNILTQQISAIITALEEIPTASTSNPLMAGTASPGSSISYSRGDHVHPKDTSKVDKATTVNGKALSSNITLNASDIPNDSTVPGEKVDDALDSLKGSLTRNVFVIKGTLKSNITALGNIFTQTTASDSRITTSTEVANIEFDNPTYITSGNVTVIPGNGTVTVTGTTSTFSGTINVTIELYNL